MKLYNRKKNWLHQLKPVQMLFIFYFALVIISTMLLSLPISQQEGVDLPFIDVLFTAVSAVSVTGLSTISIADSLSTAGIIILAVIMQFGAVGVMAIGTMIWLILGKKIGLKERRLIMTDQNQSSIEGIVRLTKQVVFIFLFFELIGFLLLGTYFLQYFPNAKEAYLQGFFGTVSAISNGGFDITGNSLIFFQKDYFVQSANMLLIIVGAIGFPVLIEVKEYIVSKKKRKFRFSLLTKVTSTTFFLLIPIGALGIYLFDFRNYFAGLTWHENLFYALFQSVTTRSGGLATLDVSQLTEENHLFMSILMFIGASPNSAGGGIRTTTFALVVIFMITYIRGGKGIHVFRREVHEEDLVKAVTVTFMAILIFVASVFVLSIVEDFSLSQIIFEVTSAFGTVGLSLGITAELHTISKIILMMLMFIGRIGILTFLFMFAAKKPKERIRYPKERISIG